ncbi:ATP binding [Candidozyma auris]|uniref:mitogen-activated protein kinase kinase kinase n=2 Tax=Candidozyma auris TaxID=498019 RepID=A0A2H0ZDD1_CANAR|nr:mitogen-activated protein kinase kinase kinase STE11 [[Candida] auris]KND99462.2 hypothetical protein QG37_03599 [[Candida] auris]PIS48631.1 hypothetical protein B9J08_005331 [[Candida] auris]PIS49243.1 hypothetical protein CJI97_005414 [[Candida] auris]PSK75727.1 hypothetical protein CJJ07_004473 [[Candida] auris]QEL61868.1 hypothetical protein CJJ09_004026 [[Candida] auris]
MEFSDLQGWLQKCKCSQYLGTFIENGITLDLVPELDSEALKELGITKLGDKLRLEVAISNLNKERLQHSVNVQELQRQVQSELAQLTGSGGETNGSMMSSANDDSTFLGTRSSLSRSHSKSESHSNSNSNSHGSSGRTVTFILPDGSMKKVNIEGCFNTQSIKRKALKTLGVKGKDTDYDTYIHTTGPGGAKIASLHDVEFVTTCFAPDRTEKHRIMLTPKGEQPTSTAAEQSLRILQRMAGRKPQAPQMRKFFGQRPPSELISSNLGEYFPQTPQEDLETTVRNSVRYSMRLSRRFRVPTSSSIFSGKSGRVSMTSSERRPRNNKTIGDMMVNNVSVIDEATNPQDTISLGSRGGDSMAEDGQSMITRQTESSKHRFSVAASYTTNNNRYSRIELFSIDSDDENTDDCLDYYAEIGNDGYDVHPFVPGRKWVQGARIGSGSFGTVVLGMDPMTGELMAVKQVPIPTGAARHNDSQRSMIEALHHEMTLLKELNHENIVRYYGSSSEGSFLNIFLEYVPGGSVQSMLQSYGPFEEPLIRNFVRQVLVGLSYLHSVDIIHRDIKGANILIDIKGTVKISDFGISKKVDSSEDREGNKQARRASLQGSVYWMAPEVVKQTAYTKKADIWSVGCLVVEMFTGKHPFPSFSQMQAIFKIGTHTQPQVPEWCTAEGKDFLTKTFEIDYDKRPTASQLLCEAFLNPLILSHSA